MLSYLPLGSWVNVRLFTYAYGHVVREVAGSSLGHNTTVGVFQATSKVFSARNENLTGRDGNITSCAIMLTNIIDIF